MTVTHKSRKWGGGMQKKILTKTRQSNPLKSTSVVIPRWILQENRDQILFNHCIQVWTCFNTKCWRKINVWQQKSHEWVHTLQEKVEVTNNKTLSCSELATKTTDLLTHSVAST